MSMSDLLQYTLNRLHPRFAEYHFDARCDAMRFRYNTNFFKILSAYLSRRAK